MPRAPLLLLVLATWPSPMTGGSEVIQDKDYRPCPYNALSVRVKSRVRADVSGTDTVYTYTYTVENSRASMNVVDKFLVTPIPQPLTVEDPRGWIHIYGFERDSALCWGVVGFDTTHAMNIRIEPENIQPGSATTGFVLRSRARPSRVHFYVQGFDSLPHYGEDGSRLPEESIFKLGVFGPALGPR